jgi:hypothetical protein
MNEQTGFVNFDVFGYRVWVIFTDDLQKSRSKYDRKIGASCVIENAAALHAAVNNHSYVFLQWKAKPEQIAHEAYHAIDRMMLYAGVAHENENMAYHIGHLVGCIHTMRGYFRRKNVSKRTAV